MSLFAIRDDDTSFFTKPEELEAIYRHLWGQIPISLAVVPFTVAAHRDVVFSNSAPEEQTFPLGENVDLVIYLKERLQHRDIEVMLHGFTHQYRKNKWGWLSEYTWKSEHRLHTETRTGKCYLEDLLNTQIRVFVPPNNKIGKAGVRAVVTANLHICYGSGRGVIHPCGLTYAKADLRRWMFGILRRRRYPFPLDLGTHKESVSYELNFKKAAYERLRDALEYCIKLSAPFVLATHYWQFQRYPTMLAELYKLVDHALKLGAKPATVSECMGSSVNV
ncbi:MAG: hypothetical protein C4291_03760 [Candidatus Dadabacteria bacterium]